ncbi:MAG: hypothetical protein LC799_29605 [Actinobacteria bacterium]|nr:hypothetical protein [Actinomycetota bacterium]
MKTTRKKSLLRRLFPWLAKSLSQANTARRRTSRRRTAAKSALVTCSSCGTVIGYRAASTPGLNPTCGRPSCNPTKMAAQLKREG